MKKVILLWAMVAALFGAKKADYAQVISSDIETSVIEFNIDDFNLVPVQTAEGIMHLARLENGASLLKKGAPDVQKISRSVIIPDDGEMKIEVLASEFTDYENVLIAPSKGNFSRLINPKDVPYEFGVEYKQDAFFPTSTAKLQDPYILRNMRGQTIDFQPLQYNPVQKVLRVYNYLKIMVYNAGESKNNVLSRKSGTQVISREYSNIYDTHFLNYSNDNRFEYLEDRGNYLIISYGGFMEEMQPLVDWKNKKGIPTEMVDVADIGSSSSAIENYVDNYYYNQGLTFLLLVGDIAQIPSPSVSGSASDPSYGFIEGNDAYAEVIVGRFSGSTPAQIATQVERSIEYERDPQGSADWYDNAMGVASTQGPGFGGYTDAEFNDFLWDTVLSPFTYDSYDGVYDSGGSLSQGMAVINDGVSLINYTGHGYQGGWGNGAPLSTSNVHTLTNSNMLPFVISVACNVGEFNTTNECFAEAWLRATNNGEPTGAIGHIGSTISQSWEPPMHGQYGMMLLLTESYEGHITRSMGGITTNGCMYMNDAQGSNGIYETQYWTLFGDPSIEIRTDQPSTLNVGHDAAIVVGQSELSINTGVDNALAALSKNGELLAFAYSDNGNAVLDLSNADLLPDDYDLVVTSFNTYPYETTVSVITPDGPYITVDSYMLNDESWDGNGMADFGEFIAVEIQANNVGVDNATNVTAEISINDPYIYDSYGIINFGNIPAGSSANAGGFSFNIDYNVPDGHLAEFTVSFSSNEGQWDGGFTIPIHAPTLTVSNPSFVDAGGDGVWDAGEEITLTLLLNNEGTADHFNYPGVHLTENSSDAEISPDTEYFWLYGIQAGTSTPVNFVVTADENANMGSVVSFTAYGLELNCVQDETGDCIMGEEYNFTLTIGLPFNEDLHEPLNLSASTGENSIDLSWEEPFTCPDGQFADCEGQCVDDWYEAWVGDGICDDGDYGVWFNCAEFNYDGGDCGTVVTCEDQGLVTCPNGTCEESLDDCPETSCEAGYVDDCAGDGDCCPESWIGDGWADCEDQAYGCDLTCYDNDGGDCGGRNENPQNEKEGMMYPSRLNADFSNSVYLPEEFREVEGYFVYREGAYLTYTDELGYSDVSISFDGMEYCYHVTAVYEEGQSGASNTACANAPGEPGCTTGDVNCDNTLNILDIVLVVNMALGLEEPNYDTGDINGDGVINILDVISLVNLVLGNRVIQTNELIGTKANIYQEGKSVSISADGSIAGVQMVMEAETITLNENLPLTVKINVVGDEYIILAYGVNGETLSGEKIQLLTADEDYDITTVIVADVLGKAMSVEWNDRLLPDALELSQNYPNPFNPNTQIQFTLGQEELVNLDIYDIQGRKVVSLINNKEYSAGYHTISWDGKNSFGSQVPSGMYFYKLAGDHQTLTRKMVMMK